MLEEKYQKIVSVAFPSTGVPYFLMTWEHIIKLTVIPIDFDGGKSHGRKKKNPKNPLKIWKNPQIRSQNRRIFRSEKISYAFSWSDTPLEENTSEP